MFKESVIKECLFGLAQFNQPADPKYPTLDSALTTSLTGRVINRVHPLLSIENLYNVAPEFGAYVYPAWVSGAVLKKGVIVSYNSQLYVTLQALTALQNVTTPDLSASFELSNAFSAWLTDVCQQSAIELATLLIQNKKLDMLTKDILETTLLYQGAGLLTEREVKQGRFVGYIIEMKPNQSLLTVIDSIGIQLDEVLPTLPIYLYHSSKQDPVVVGNISADGALSFKWSSVTGFDLKSVDFTAYDSGGYFYLGYYEDDLGSAQAVAKQMNISRPCSLCNRYNNGAYKTWSKRFILGSMYVPASAINVGKTLFDTSAVVINNDRNYGLNLSIYVTCDTSYFFCKHKLLFADAYAKLVGVNLMKQIAYSTRINAIPEMTRATAGSELDPKKDSGSLMDEFNKALKAVNYDFSGLDSDCLPCSSRGRITYGAI